MDHSSKPQLVWDGQKQGQERHLLEDARLRIDRAAHLLEPATPEMAALELSRCLTLCAPSGMTQDDRAEWISIAMLEVEELPSGALREACKVARTTCKHPSELIPTIVSTATAVAENLQKDHRWAVQAYRNLTAPKITDATNEEIGEEEKDEVRRLMAELSADMQRKARAWS